MCSLIPDATRPRCSTGCRAYPTYVTGVSGTKLACIPFESRLTGAYLHTIQRFSEDSWIDSCKLVGDDIGYVWRDGESAFLLPDSVEREKYWLGVAKRTERLSLASATRTTRFREPAELASDAYRSYPVHSFAAWMKEFRMLGYLRALEKIEDRLESMEPIARLLWLQAINSDVLSAVEKASPSVRLRANPRTNRRKNISTIKSCVQSVGSKGKSTCTCSKLSIRHKHAAICAKATHRIW